jgi:cytochrome P450 family 307 subfamily A
MYNSMFLLFSSNTLYIMVTCFVLTLILIANELNSKQLKKRFLWKSATTAAVGMMKEMKSHSVEAPGPKGKFIVGNLDVLNGHGIPYKAFSELARKYGKVIKLQLGSVPSLVINGVENIKEVMIYKGSHFNARPNFQRYHLLFSGNKENCELQTMLKPLKMKLTHKSQFLQHSPFVTGLIYKRHVAICSHHTLFLVHSR